MLRMTGEAAHDLRGLFEKLPPKIGRRPDTANALIDAFHDLHGISRSADKAGTMLTALSFAVILFRRGRISGHLDSLHMNNFGLILCICHNIGDILRRGTEQLCNWPIKPKSAGSV